MRALWSMLLVPAALTALSPQDNNSCSGTVKNQITGEPIKGASVTLIKAPDPTGRPPKPEFHTMLSGPGGEFSFTGLSKGQYSLQALKPGFVPAGIESDDGPGNMVMI